MSAMPHCGHLPGLLLNTAGCMGQVYVLLTVVVSVFPLGAFLSCEKETYMVRQAIASNSNFFICYKFYGELYNADGWHLCK
jgi:hypothetical protein